MKGQFGEDGGFRCGIQSCDVGGRVRLRVAQRLCLCQDIRIVGSFLLHLGEDEVGGAIHDPEYTRHAIPGQGLPQRSKQRNRSRHGCLEVQIHPVFGSRSMQRRTVDREEGLVGRHDGRSRCHRLEDEATSWLDPSHQLHNDVAATSGQGPGIIGEQRRGHALPRPGSITNSDTHEFQRGAYACCQVGLLLQEEPGNLGSHGASTQQGDGDRHGHAGLLGDRSSRQATQRA